MILLIQQEKGHKRNIYKINEKDMTNRISLKEYGKLFTDEKK